MSRSTAVESGSLAGPGVLRRAVGIAGDVGLAMLLVLAIPFAIAVISGLVRLAIEAVR